ncbi:MAG TPA: hypothetical protein VHN77_02405 [Phycisphaerales bacterium]|nr:hypothetical protein [Phycisphaerales bacterium]
MNVLRTLILTPPPLCDDAGRDVAFVPDAFDVKEALTGVDALHGRHAPVQTGWSMAAEARRREGRSALGAWRALLAIAPLIACAGAGFALAVAMGGWGLPNWALAGVFGGFTLLGLWTLPALRLEFISRGICLRAAVLRLTTLRCGACGHDLTSHATQEGLCTCSECGARWDLSAWRREFPRHVQPVGPRSRVWSPTTVDRRGRRVGLATPLSHAEFAALRKQPPRVPVFTWSNVMGWVVAPPLIVASASYAISRLYPPQTGALFTLVVLPALFLLALGVLVMLTKALAGRRSSLADFLSARGTCACCLAVLEGPPARDGNTVCRGCGAAWLVKVPVLQAGMHQ